MGESRITRRRVLGLGFGLATSAALALAACGDDDRKTANTASSVTATTSPPPTASPAAPTETSSPVPPTATLQPPSPTITPVPPTATSAPPTATPAPIGSVVASAPELNGDPGWETAIRTTDGASIGFVLSPELNIRVAPGLDAEIVGSTFQGHTVLVYDFVINQNDGGHWYRVGYDRYVSAWYVAPFAASPVEETFAGHWIDVNLSRFYAIAYMDDVPVYAALITAGRDEKTPLGSFYIFYRVRSETMDSATVGIPEGEPGHYYLEDVQYTQYFKQGGFAVHGNHWTPPSQFGQFSSNGCIGLMNWDAGWFWDFLSEGSAVSIHY